ncbi:hypothetical protein TNCV_1271921 [Trichonephila clavipes]|nr:hypothetical protein TNCV_1271921 [Trichonephila clavipes]
MLVESRLVIVKNSRVRVAFRLKTCYVEELMQIKSVRTQKLHTWRLKGKNDTRNNPPNLQDNLNNKTKKIEKRKERGTSNDFVFLKKIARLSKLTKPPELIETHINYENLEYDVNHAFEPEPDIVVPKDTRIPMHTSKYCEVLSSAITLTTFDIMRKPPFLPRAGCKSGKRVNHTYPKTLERAEEVHWKNRRERL